MAFKDDLIHLVTNQSRIRWPVTFQCHVLLLLRTRQFKPGFLSLDLQSRHFNLNLEWKRNYLIWHWFHRSHTFAVWVVIVMISSQISWTIPKELSTEEQRQIICGWWIALVRRWDTLPLGMDNMDSVGEFEVTQRRWNTFKTSALFTKRD